MTEQELKYRGPGGPMSVEVAIIDSGINPWHSHVQGVAGGIAFRLRAAGEAVADDDFRDGLGHGTAIAGVIREQAPRADLFAVKIFHGELNAPMELLRAALEWVIDRRIKLVHLSLGTVREKNRPVLEALCRQAVDSRIVIVAAAPGTDSAPPVNWYTIRICRSNSAHTDGPERFPDCRCSTTSAAAVLRPHTSAQWRRVFWKPTRMQMWRRSSTC
jgi:subtilisin family serine protease